MAHGLTDDDVEELQAIVRDRRSRFQAHEPPETFTCSQCGRTHETAGDAGWCCRRD